MFIFDCQVRLISEIGNVLFLVFTNPPKSCLLFQFEIFFFTVLNSKIS